MIEEFDEKDYKTINNLIKTTTSIDNLYEKLFTYQINNKKEEFNETIEYLHLALEVEDNLYSEINSLKSLDYGAFLFKERIPSKKIDDDIEFIIQNKKDNRIIRRILFNLKQNVLKDKDLTDFILEIVPMNFVSGISIFSVLDNKISEPVSMEISDEDDIGIISYKGTKIINRLLEDVLIHFLERIENIEKSLTKTENKRELIKVKYNTSFINKNVEKILLKNNFMIEKPTMYDNDIMSELFDIDKLEYKNIVQGYSTDEIIYQMYKILFMKDNEYKNKEQEMILVREIINSFMNFVDKEDINYINSEYMKTIESDAFKEYTGEYISKKVMKKILKNGYNKEKEIIKKIF